MHEDRWRFHGSLDDPRPTSEQRFWSKVRKRGPTPKHRPELGPCWIWTAGKIKHRGGYGLFQVGQQQLYAHRFAYELLIGPVPSGLELDHLCRNPACVNPAHLEAVTHAENVRRGMAGWVGRAKTRCPRGHPYDEANTYRNPNRTNRICKTCRRKYQRAWMRRQRTQRR